MKKTALLSLVLSACAATIRTPFPQVRSVVMLDAGAYILLTDDGSGALVPRKVFAENVRIIPDVPENAPMWAEMIDVPGDLPGEGDRLVLHVHRLENVESADWEGDDDGGDTTRSLE